MFNEDFEDLNNKKKLLYSRFFALKIKRGKVFSSHKFNRPLSANQKRVVKRSETKKKKKKKKKERFSEEPARAFFCFEDRTREKVLK